MCTATFWSSMADGWLGNPRRDRASPRRGARLVDPPGRALVDLLGGTARIDRLAGRGSPRKPGSACRPSAGLLWAGGGGNGPPPARRTTHPRGISLAALRDDRPLPPVARQDDRPLRHARADFL